MNEYVWKLGIKYDPNQARVPAGQPGGGRWTSDGGSYREFGDLETLAKNEFTIAAAGASTYQHHGDDIGAAVDYYKGSGYMSLNLGLRHGEKMSSFDEEQVAKLDTFTQEGKLPENAVLYRGIGRKNVLAQQFGTLTGAIITDNGFMSTTIDGPTGREFAGLHFPNPERRGILMRILAPKGQPCGVTFSGEREFILPRGVRMRVISESTATVPPMYSRDTEKKLRILEVEIIQ